MTRSGLAFAVAVGLVLGGCGGTGATTGANGSAVHGTVRISFYGAREIGGGCAGLSPYQGAPAPGTHVSVRQDGRLLATARLGIGTPILDPRLGGLGGSQGCLFPFSLRLVVSAAGSYVFQVGTLQPMAITGQAILAQHYRVLLDESQ